MVLPAQYEYIISLFLLSGAFFVFTVRMGEVVLAIQEEFAKRVYRHAPTHRSALLVVRRSSDTAVCLASWLVQSHCLPDGRDAGEITMDMLFTSKDAWSSLHLQLVVFNGAIVE